jgi:hypothetical protein
MLQLTIWWFHQITGHPGSKCLHAQISTHYYHHDLWCLIDNYHCDHCQRNKLDGKGYGHLPECKIRSIPFEECVVDLIGHWTIQVQEKPYEFNALTMIDTVSNLVELVRIDDKTLATIARKKHTSGFQDTHCQRDVSMTMEANSLDQSSSFCYKVVELRMF